MSIKLGVADTTVSHLKPRIAVIGVGGGGGNAVNNMIAKNLEGVDFVVANTDAQALAHSSASRKIQLGLEITQGLGAGARPEIGKIAAEEAKEEIARELEGVNMVFITAGMGGGTGSGAAPVVAHIAKEKGILTVGVVTKPFSFEGRKRMETAESALANFTSEVDSIIVIPNQNLFRIADKNTTLADAFLLADNVLYSGVRSITDLMMMPGLINLDFADVKNIMQDKGKAIMGTGEAEGEKRAEEAAKQALSNPLLDDCTMHGAKGVLINITGGDDITLMEIDAAANIIKEEVDDNANIIFGSSYDESLAGKIRFSIVVTGINDGKPQPEVLPKTKEPSLIDQSYDDSAFVPTIEMNDAVENEPVSLDVNEDEIAASEPDLITETISEETTEADENLDKDFASLDKSDELPEVPQASALFSAIMNSSANKADDADNSDIEFNSIAPKDADSFSSRTSIQSVNESEEPVLFKEYDTDVFKDFKPVENETLPLEDDGNDDVKPTFIERVMGIRARKKNKDETENNSDEMEKFTSDENETPELSGDELDIPSFLRRK